jgi:hypothetical protein
MSDELKLSEELIRLIPPSEWDRTFWDGQGLYLQAPAKGKKRWRFKFRFGGKEQLISLGVYPEVSLGDARERCQTARKQLAMGLRPQGVRKGLLPLPQRRQSMKTSCPRCGLRTECPCESEIERELSATPLESVSVAITPRWVIDTALGVLSACQTKSDPELEECDMKVILQHLLYSFSALAQQNGYDRHTFVMTAAAAADASWEEAEE